MRYLVQIIKAPSQDWATLIIAPSESEAHAYADAAIAIPGITSTRVVPLDPMPVLAPMSAYALVPSL